ncbi:MAG: hypothetical protein Q4C55_03610 [Eubacterium sp.]|nr:hypothetical protein [Eubacterium sp.]
MWCRLKRRLEAREGSTLPEVLTALVLMGVLLLGILGITVAAGRGAQKISENAAAQREFRHLVLYLQKQIRQSRVVGISSRGLCLEDMESRRLGYLNYYTYDAGAKMIYRHKVTEDGKNQGTRAQLAAAEMFSMDLDETGKTITLVIKMEGCDVVERKLWLWTQTKALPW